MLTPTGNSHTRTARLVMVLVTLSVTAVACSTVETQSFTVAKTSNVESAYMAVNADFSKYDQLLIDEMGIFFPNDSYTPAEDIKRIRQIFRSAFIYELRGYTIVDTATPNTMNVQASLIDLRNSSSGTLMSLSREIRDIASHGELLFLMEMRDSESSAVLVRVADSAQTPTFATSEGIATDWTSVEEAAQHWAALFRNFLDKYLGH
jgi:hypothetical protein